MPAAERQQLLQLVAAESDRRYDDSRAVLELAGGRTRPADDSGAAGLTEAELLADAFAELNAAPGVAPDPPMLGVAQAGSGDSLPHTGRETAAATALRPSAIAPERLEALLQAAASSSSSRGSGRFAGREESDGDGSGDGDGDGEEDVGATAGAELGGGGGLTLSMLSKEERKVFLRAVASGELAEVLPLDEWQPWWLQQHSASAAAATASPAAVGASPAHEEGSDGAEPPICVARLAAPLPPLSTLVKTRPPAGILFCNAVSIIAAYAHVQRLYAGDWSGESALELARLMLSLTAVLSADARFENPALACDAFTAAASNPEVSLAGARKDASLAADTSPTAAAPSMRARSLALLPLRDAWCILQGGREWSYHHDVAADAGSPTLPSMRLPGSDADSPGRGSQVLIAEAVELPAAAGPAPDGPSLAAAAGSSHATHFVLPGRHYAVDALLHCRSVFEGAIAEAQADVHSAHAHAARQSGGGKAATTVSVPLRVMPRVLRQLQVASRKLHFFAVWAWDSTPGGGMADEELASACAALTAELRRREAADAAASAASARSTGVAAAPRAVLLGR